MRKLQATLSLIALPICLAIIGSAADCWAQQIAMPYDAFVLQDKTKVYCGPGGGFYPTHELDQGAMVKVYRHDPGGWCAIRPPEKSFSLIPESAVKMLTENIGEVLADDTQTWVGTLLGPVEKPLPQVKVDRGERIFVIGEVAWPHPSGTTNVWYQIEPPAGEFHWIRMSEIQLPPDDNAPQNSPEPTVSRNASAIPVSPAPPKDSDTFTDGSSAQAVNFEAPVRDNQRAFQSEDTTSGWRTATKPIPQSRATNDDSLGTNDRRSFGSSNFSSPNFDSPNYDTRARDRNDQFDRSNSQPPPRFASLENMNSQVQSFNASVPQRPTSVQNRTAATSLIELEDRLSRQIIKDYSQWRLADIKLDAEQMYQTSDDAVQRMALQRVLDKIKKFESLREGFQSTSTLPDFGDKSTRPFGSGIDPNVEQGTTYDATGLLKQLASSSGSMDPTYVLQDSRGKVTHHVAGSAGLNLNRYLNARVGIIGRRGYNRRLNLKHVTADRLIVLQP